MVIVMTTKEIFPSDQIKNSMIFVLLQCGYEITEAEKIARDVSGYYLRKNHSNFSDSSKTQEVA
jgi:hypothetical protein